MPIFVKISRIYVESTKKFEAGFLGGQDFWTLEFVNQLTFFCSCSNFSFQSSDMLKLFY